VLSCPSTLWFISVLATSNLEQWCAKQNPCLSGPVAVSSHDGTEVKYPGNAERKTSATLRTVHRNPISEPFDE